MVTRADLAIVPGSAPGRPPCTWRALGRAGDLDLDFASADRPRLVSSVLLACAEPPLDDPETVWRLSCAARIGGLLAVVAETDGLDALELQLACPDCGAGLEVALPVAALLALARAAEATAETGLRLASGPVRLRRPTGADQRTWRQASPADPAAARETILASLVTAGTPEPAEFAEVEAALQVFDPLPAFEIDVTCPDCAARSDVPVDLEAVLLARLARARDDLLAEVDALARRYGWTEAEILAVPPWRRRRYRAIAGRAEGWP